MEQWYDKYMPWNWPTKSPFLNGAIQMAVFQILLTLFWGT